MVKILLVEDEAEKKRLIVAALVETGVILDTDIDTEGDAFLAKRRLAESKYDLLILDINIPKRLGQAAEVGAGLEVLHFVKTNKKAHAPTYIVGLTAYESSFAEATEDFSSALWKLVRFAYQEAGWREALESAVHYLASVCGPPFPADGKSYHYDMGIIVGLEDEELKSILALEAAWKPLEVRHDHARYHRGTFSNKTTDLTAIAVAAPRMGMPAASVAATKLIYTFRPRLLAISGICAGVRRKTKIGDVLIADPCWDWGSGKWVIDPSDGKRKFLPAAYQWRLDEALRTIAKEVGNEQFFKDIYDSWKGPKPSKPPKLIVDAMASGASVLEASELMGEVRDQHKNLVGVEMESYAVFTAAEYASDPRPRCVSIKAVCDFGDSKKSNKFHEYAAYVSANFVHGFALAVKRGDQ